MLAGDNGCVIERRIVSTDGSDELPVHSIRGTLHEQAIFILSRVFPRKLNVMIRQHTCDERSWLRRHTAHGKRRTHVSASRTSASGGRVRAQAVVSAGCVNKERVIRNVSRA